MATTFETICFAVEDFAYDVADNASYLAWRLRRAMDRSQNVEFAVYLAVLLFFLAIFAMAGTSDYADEKAQLAYWAERGITIARW